MSANDCLALLLVSGEDTMAGGDRCLRVRRSRAPTTEMGAPGGGEAHHDLDEEVCGVQEGSEAGRRRRPRLQRERGRAGEVNPTKT